MPTMKRTTAQLTKHGIEPTIVIKHGSWGYYAFDRRYCKQRGTPVRDSAKDVLRDLLAGLRPEQLA